jgi:2-oxoglutarate dehydrogenase E2 component (dihydrolipoamide succinyltransferase)
MDGSRIEVAVVMLLGLAATGCGGNSAPASSPPPAPAPAAPAPAPAAPAAPAAAPTDRIDDPGFELAAQPAGPYAAGKLGTFAVSLTPRGVYHVNQEYPVSISLQGDTGLSFPKSQLAKGDAATFGEKLARFEVPFTAASAGDHEVRAKVKFAVCTPENCVPDERTLALVLAVK